MEGRKSVGKGRKTAGTTKKERERPWKAGNGVGRAGRAADNPPPAWTRKRRRRSALPAHSKTAPAEGKKSGGGQRLPARSWTAVASAARHRFRTPGHRPPTAAPAPARKRRRRFALPAHSRTLSLHPRNKEVALTRLDCGWVVTRCSGAAPVSARQLSRSRGWRGAFFGVFWWFSSKTRRADRFSGSGNRRSRLGMVFSRSGKSCSRRGKVASRRGSLLASPGKADA